MKRILAIDGGGVRGIISLQILRKLEQIIREQRNSKATLSEFFNFIGGTSAGSVIASSLALGRSVDQTDNFFTKFVNTLFSYKRPVNPIAYRGNSDALERLLQEHLGNELLGSNELRCQLLIIAQNKTTASPWPVTSNRYARFNNPDLPFNNLQIPLWKLVRASTAAPAFFTPARIEVSANNFHEFVDGGLTSFNNPSFKMFQIATIPAYKMNWQVGREHLAIVSIGSGLYRSSRPKVENWFAQLTRHFSMLTDAVESFESMIYSSVTEQDILCRMFGDVVYGEKIDAEIQNPRELEACIAAEPLFTYARLCPELTKLCHDQLGVVYDEKLSFRLDSAKSIEKCREIGKAYAEQKMETNLIKKLLSI